MHKNIITLCPHVDREFYCKGRCRSCYDKWNNSRNPEARARRLSYQKQYNQKHSAQRCKQNRELTLRRCYKITSSDYETLLAVQNGLCAICGGSTQNKKLAVDHSHIDGSVRGLLCLRCNTKLGWFEQYQEEILAYLGRWGRERKAVKV